MKFSHMHDCTPLFVVDLLLEGGKSFLWIGEEDIRVPFDAPHATRRLRCYAVVSGAELEDLATRLLPFARICRWSGRSATMQTLQLEFRFGLGLKRSV